MTDNSSVPSPSIPAPSIPIPVSPLWLRVLVTIGMFAIYRLGFHIPLPGLDPNALGRLGPHSTLTPEHVSIFALGVIPIFSALALAEIAKLIVPPFGRWAVAERYNARRLNRIVRYLALVLAAFQAFGIAGGLMQISGFVFDPGWTFRLVTVITLVAATALLGWLGDQITLHGFGNGFWLLLIAPSLMRLPEAIIGTTELLQVEDVSPSALAVAIGFVVVAIAVLVALAIAHARAGAAVPAVGHDVLDVWPPLVAIYMSGLALLPVVFLQGNNSALAVGNPVRLVVIAALIALFCFLRTLSRPPADAWGWQLVKLTAAAQIVICVVAEVLARYLDVPFVLNGPWLILAVAIVMSALLSNAGKMTADQSPLPTVAS